MEEQAAGEDQDPQARLDATLELFHGLTVHALLGEFLSSLHPSLSTPPVPPLPGILPSPPLPNALPTDLLIEAGEELCRAMEHTLRLVVPGHVVHQVLHLPGRTPSQAVAALLAATARLVKWESYGEAFRRSRLGQWLDEVLAMDVTRRQGLKAVLYCLLETEMSIPWGAVIEDFRVTRGPWIERLRAVATPAEFAESLLFFEGVMKREAMSPAFVSERGIAQWRAKVAEIRTPQDAATAFLVFHTSVLPNIYYRSQDAVLGLARSMLPLQSSTTLLTICARYLARNPDLVEWDLIPTDLHKVLLDHGVDPEAQNHPAVLLRKMKAAMGRAEHALAAELLDRAIAQNWRQGTAIAVREGAGRFL